MDDGAIYGEMVAQPGTTELRVRVFEGSGSRAIGDGIYD